MQTNWIKRWIPSIARATTFGSPNGGVFPFPFEKSTPSPLPNRSRPIIMEPSIRRPFCLSPSGLSIYVIFKYIKNYTIRPVMSISYMTSSYNGGPRRLWRASQVPTWLGMTQQAPFGAGEAHSVGCPTLTWLIRGSSHVRAFVRLNIPKSYRAFGISI